MQSQVDVRNITSKISDLNEKLDMSATLVEPRENAFMAFEWRHNAAGADISAALSHFGKVSHGPRKVLESGGAGSYKLYPR